MQFLVFTLYAPLSSWGDTAMGEVRGSWDRPSRSALLGLLAAAHGFERENEEAHASLDASIRMAVRAIAAGREIVDYHTAQDPSGVAIRRFRPTTRKEALECADPETTLSRRTLREDAISIVALWTTATSPWSLEDHVRALQAPRFPLYAGRKANVLGLPLAPRITTAQTLAEALGTIPPLPIEVTLLRPRDGWLREVEHDPCEGFDAGLRSAGAGYVVRRDAAPHRTRWQFADRRVHVGFLDPQERP
jgi:CRISPR system Cascade subunit CasD